MPLLRSLLLLAVAAHAASGQPVSGALVSAPDVLVQRYTTDDGLPVNHVTGLAVGPDGYLWASTFDGLARFDGHRFEVFNVDNTPGLTTNRLLGLTVGPDGALWIQTEADEIIRFSDGVAVSTRSAWDVGRSITVPDVAGGAVWILGEEGLWRYQDDVAKPFLPDQIHGPVKHVAVDDRGGVWVVEPTGLTIARPDGRVETVSTASLGAALAVLPDRDGAGAWIGTDGGLARWTPRGLRRIGPRVWTWQVERVGAEVWAAAHEGWVRVRGGDLAPLAPEAGEERPPFSTALRRDPRGHVWRTQGTFVYRDGRRVLDVGGGPAPHSLAVDLEGNVWAATDGLVRIQPRSVHVWPGSEGAIVYPVLQDARGTVWAGLWQEPNGLLRTPLGGDAERLPLGFVAALQTTRDGTLWASVREEGLVALRSGGRIDRIGFPISKDVGQDVSVIHEARDGRLWLGARTGLIVGTPSPTGSPASVRWRSLPLAHRVRQIVTTRDGDLLVGTQGGGLWRHLPGDRWETLSTAEGLAADAVRDVYEDDRGVLWIALEAGGLCRLDRGGRRSLRAARPACLSVRDGLFDASLHRVLADDDGRLWLSSNRGVFWILRDEADAVALGRAAALTTVGYTERDGMPDREANGGSQPAGIRLRDGRFLFPTQRGIAVFDPSELRPPLPPPARIEGTTSPAGQTLGSAPVRLRPGTRDLTIRYTGISFASPDAVRFRVRLEGYDADWQAAGARREAVYTNLPPGRYTFRVQAGLGGRWGEEAHVAIVRQPHVWETVWFWPLVIAAALALAAVALRRRLTREADQRTALEATVRERTAALRAANEAKDRLLANVSHELRTPLTLLLGPIRDAASGRLDVGARARALFERAEPSGRRLARLVDDLLTLARHDGAVPTLEPVEIVGFLRARLAAFSAEAEARGVALTVRPAVDALWLDVDPQALETILYNLIANALAFTPSGGAVTVDLDTENTDAVLTVSDTGPGIAPEHLPHLFDRFYQADPSSTRRHGGAGIGLALVRQLAESHRGSVEVESTVGEGTTFTVRLPGAHAHAGGDGHVEATQATVPHGSRTDETSPEDADRPLVLVVEDHAGLRSYLRDVLGDAYRVEEAVDGADGIERARDAIPDLVLSDVMMPGADGIEVLRTLRADVRTSHVPVVLLTARADVESRIEGLGEGADDYLAKPFDAAELLARVGNLIAQRRALHERWSRRSALDPTPADVPSREVTFLDALRDAAEAGLADAGFGVDALAEAVAMSPRQLARKLKALTAETPGAYLRGLRLARGADLLRAGYGVSEAADAVGFTSRSQFGLAFREAYGVPPSDYAETTSEADRE